MFVNEPVRQAEGSFAENKRARQGKEPFAENRQAQALIPDEGLKLPDEKYEKIWERQHM